MIEQFHIIPIEQHCIYYHGVDTELLKEMHEHRSPQFIVDSAMCYAKLIEKTPANICINKFCNTRLIQVFAHALQ